MADEKRTEVVAVYVTPTDKARVKRAATAARRTESDWALGLFLAAIETEGEKAPNPLL